jgi:hypothetical protein
MSFQLTAYRCIKQLIATGFAILFLVACLMHVACWYAWTQLGWWDLDRHYRSRFTMRTLIICARIRDEWPCVHNDMHKHLATDGSISVTNFICFRPFCPSIVMNLRSYCIVPWCLYTYMWYIFAAMYIPQFMHAYSLYIQGSKLRGRVAMEKFWLANICALIWELVLGIMVTG